ncbi:hypothetical protein ACHAQJ_001878 [Trichoderma viride]
MLYPDDATILAKPRPLILNKITDDVTSTASGSTILTPSDTIIADLWDGNFHQVPWPGRVYMIQEKASKRAITFRNGSLFLQGTGEDGDECQHWLCVEAEGYFGFFNSRSGKYLGHNGGWDIKASAVYLQGWEYFTPRRHPKGGYQLLMPYHQTLREVAVYDEGQRLVGRQHGTTLWEFVTVPKL